MRILMLIEEAPSPPVNGRTIPAHHHARLLRSLGHRVEVLIAHGPGCPPAEHHVEATRQAFDAVHCVEWSRDRGAFVREWLGGPPAFTCGRLHEGQLSSALDGSDYDLIWATPIAPTGLVGQIERSLPTRRRAVVAAISDVYTCVLRSHGPLLTMGGFRLRDRLGHLARWLRSFPMARSEAMVLANADAIVVQTGVERRWLTRMSKGRFDDRVHVIPNGCDVSSALSVRTAATGRVLHAGALSHPVVGRTVDRLVTTIWPGVLKSLGEHESGAELLILGRGARRELQRKISRTASVVQTDWSDDFAATLAGCDAIVVRNEKNLGIINRTLEAMAAGVVVVGEPGAFNGIDGFEDGVHGLVATSDADYARHLATVLRDNDLRVETARAAQELVAKSFRWDQRRGDLDSLLRSVPAVTETSGGAAARAA